MKRLILAILVTCLNGMFTSWPAGAENAGEPLAPILLSAAQVDSAGIFLHQLLQTEDARCSNILVAPAPGPTQTLVLSRAQIAAAAAKRFPQLVLTNWSGAEQVRVSRRVRPLPEIELQEQLTQLLQNQFVREQGTLELTLGRPWATLSVPDEPVTIKVLDLPTAGVTPSFILRFEVRTEKESLGTWTMPLKAQIWREVWVARSPQPRGCSLRDADLQLEKRDLLQLREPFLARELSDSALELAENLSTGAPLLRRSVRLRPVIFRGRMLDAVVQEGALLITVRVEALEDGLPGQLIRVRNSKSRVEFRGKVQNEQTVTVTL